MMEQQYLLRVEAVNLANFVYDTNKIQPMRGGGFLLLESVKKLVEEKPKPTFAGVSLEKITTGASIGIFSFLSGTSDPQKVADKVLESLNRATGNHATFVVDWVAATGKFEHDLEVLQAKNRWRQYQQPTLVLPESKQSEGACAFDGIRPGVEKQGDPDGNTIYLSDSVAFRKDKGSSLRSGMYNLILDTTLDDEFTDELHELAKNPDKDNLNNKIAFIYFDGNKFSKIRKRCDTSEKMTDFSAMVEEPRKAFLEALLALARDPKNEFKTEKKGKEAEKIRLETMLWGGDELEIIVPAWKGCEVVRLFMEQMKTANYDNIQLTHAGGIVFCGNKAPIRLVRRMARDLAEEVKDSISDDFKSDDLSGISHTKHDLFHLLTLESFDTVGTNIGQFAKSYFGANAWQQMRMGFDDMNKLNDAIDIMRKYDFPRNKIFEIVRAVKCEESPDKIDDRLGNALTGNEKKADIIKTIDAFTGKTSTTKTITARWYLIAELWDYVGVKP